MSDGAIKTDSMFVKIIYLKDYFFAYQIEDYLLLILALVTLKGICNIISFGNGYVRLLSAITLRKERFEFSHLILVVPTHACFRYFFLFLEKS